MVAGPTFRNMLLRVEDRINNLPNDDIMKHMSLTHAARRTPFFLTFQGGETLFV